MIRFAFLSVLCLLLPFSAMGNGAFYSGGAVGADGASGVSPSDNLQVNDDVLIIQGTSNDTWCVWDTSTTPDRRACFMTDADGVGTDGVIYSVYEGTDDIVLGGGLQCIDDESIAFGTGSDQTITYVSASTETRWNDGTTDIIVVQDDAATVDINGTIAGANDDTITNSVDGVWTFAGVGGSNNEDLSIDTETTPNEIGVSSSTGVTEIDFGSIDLAAGDATLSGDLVVPVANKVILDGPGGTDYISSSGATFDIYFLGVRRANFGTSGWGTNDDYRTYIGTSLDAWLEWDTAPAPDEFSLNLTNVDGGGTDGKIFYVSEGTDDVVFGGGIQLEDDEALTLGTGSDQTVIYDSANTQTEWNDGTTDVIVIEDDSSAVSLSAGLKARHIVIDCDDDGYSIPATAHYITIETGTGTCTGNMDVTLPAVACTPQTAPDNCRRLNIARIGAVQVDVAGNGAETINGVTSYSMTSSYQTITLIETNSTSTSWRFE